MTCNDFDFVSRLLGESPTTAPTKAPPITKPAVQPERRSKPGEKPWKLPPNEKPEDLPRPKAKKHQKAAESMVAKLLEDAVDVGEFPDLIHNDRKTGLKTRKHPLGNNPAYPAYKKTGKPDNFEELQASEQYQATLKKLNQYFQKVSGKTVRGSGDLNTLFSTVMAGVQTLIQKEQSHKPALEALAISLIFQLPKFKKFKAPYEAGEFKIDAKLGKPDMEGVQFSDEVEDEREEMENFKDIDLEVQKRHFINAMIQGGAVGDNYSFHLVQDELNAIDPSLIGLYGLLMASTEVGYFIFGDAMIRGSGKSGASVGSAKLDMEGEVPVIRARGVAFPVLVQELIKGLFELVAASGLPGDKRVRQYVTSKTDLLDAETWHMLIGRGLWKNFIAQLDTTEDEFAMHLYQKLVALPPREFNAAMQKIQAKGPEGKSLLQKMVREIQHDIETGATEDEPTPEWLDKPPEDEETPPDEYQEA